MKSKDQHYVNNKQLSSAVMDYVTEANRLKDNSEEAPTISGYIGQCILKIAQRLSLKGNFSQYTYRDEMVMDGVKDCIKAVMNYDITKITRTGSPNAFGYFTQICYYAFLRRIAKEKKQEEIRQRCIDMCDDDMFMDDDNNNQYSIAETTRNRTKHFRPDRIERARPAKNKHAIVKSGIEEFLS